MPARVDCTFETEFPGVRGAARAVRAVGSFLLLLMLSAGFSAVAETPCADCHEDGPDAEAFAASVHGSLDCVDCHSGAEDLPHSEEVGRTDCAICHDETVEEYATSIHGVARENGAGEAPGCASCHGEIHALVASSDPASPVHPLRLPDTCGACHADPEMARRIGIRLALPLEAYRKSVHARQRSAGREGATCSSCHGSHAIFPAVDARSKIHHTRLPETCGQCHGKISRVFSSSVHGRALEHGVREAPACTDCHGEHRILSPRERGSPVFATNIPKMTCGRCHSDLRLAEKYGIETKAVPSYADSYHGLAARAGKVTVANCSSCHGVHDILPSSDPDSHIHPSNLSRTCGNCHPGAGTRYAIGSVHVLPTEKQHRAVYYVRRVYLWIIVLFTAFALTHNLLDLRLKVRSPVRWTGADAGQARERMSRGFRLAHGTLVISFAVLVYTGFALTYPESWWASPLLRWEESLGLRGWLHRAAALLLLGSLVFHLIHLIVDRRARACIARMRPSSEDWTEFKERLRYYFGRRPDPPSAGDLGYPEKIEYLALMWGLVVMAVSGFVLWFDNLALRWLPKWVSDLATVIHFYEAVLATLAILVWHFYFVIFDPLVYPMDTAWLTGREPVGRGLERRAHGTGRPVRGSKSASA